jgi:hypothetical protein
MPRGVRNPLPDLGGVDPIELQLAILVVLEERLGPQTREHLRRRKLQFGDALDLAGGACSHKHWHAFDNGNSGVAEIPGRSK